MLKKGIRAHDVAETGIGNICKRCAELGISYVQLVLEKSVDGFETGKFTEEYAKSIQKQLGNMRIAILGSYINPSNPDDGALRHDIEIFKEKIRYASILKPIAVGTETGIYKEGLTETEEAYKRVLQTFRELTKEAERYGVCVAVEGVRAFVINTPQKMKRLIDDISSEYVKVIFDPVNFLNLQNYQRQDDMIRETFDLLHGQLCAIHAKDFVVQEGTFKSAKPTEGQLNYRLIFEKMKEYDLDIPVICEEISDADAMIALAKLDEMRSNAGI